MRLTKSSARVTMFLGLAVIAVAGCGKKPAEQPAEATPPAVVEFKVVGLELGTSIDEQKRISAPATTFKPADVIYVSVATDGASPGATLGAKWTYGADGQLVNEMTEPVAPSGPANTEFHISKADGLPAGKYMVEVTLDGASVGVKEFEIR